MFCAVTSDARMGSVDRGGERRRDSLPGGGRFNQRGGRGGGWNDRGKGQQDRYGIGIRNYYVATL